MTKNNEPLITEEIHSKIVQHLLQTGGEIVRLRDEGRLNKRRKPDGSWVTDADYMSHKKTTAFWQKLFPAVQIVSEEDPHLPPSGIYQTACVLDPVDCTGDLTRGGRTFSIFMGIVVDNEPSHGFVYYPDKRVSALYFTGPYGKGAYRAAVKHESGKPVVMQAEQLLLSPTTDEPRIAPCYISIYDFLRKPCTTPSYNAAGNMAALLGHEVDMAAGRIMNEWDIAAFDAIVRGAGGKVISLDDKKPLTYGNPPDPSRAYLQHRYVAGHNTTLSRNGLL